MTEQSTPALVNQPVSIFHARTFFLLATLFLTVLALTVQWWNAASILPHDSDLTIRVMFIIWIPFILEAIVGFILNPRLKDNWKRLLLLVFLPPFRLGYSTFYEPNRVWLPLIGWQESGQKLFDRLERATMMPMLIIAILILPLFATQFLLKEKVAELPWLLYTLNGCEALVWLAFASEFLVLVSVTPEKFKFCKKNWLNLIIILLPLIAFLRGFQVVRAFRVAKAGKLLRVYRMRSLVLRVYQTLLAISAIERLIHRDPQKHLHSLEKQRVEKLDELNRLESKITEVRSRL